MYEVLKEWIVSIVVVVLLLSLMDMILPEGGLRKYARLATGLIVIAVVLKPVFTLLGNGDSIETSVRKYTMLQTISQQQERSKLEKNKLAKDTIDRFESNLKDAVEKEIRTSLNSSFEVTRIDVIDDVNNESYLAVEKIELRQTKNSRTEAVKEVSISITGSKEQGIEDQGEWNSKVAVLLQREFGIEKSSIKFVR